MLTYATGNDRWEVTDTWPAGAETPLYLGAGGALSFSPVAQGSESYLSDPAKPVPNLPRPVHRNDEIQGVPYRPVGFRDDDLPSALERSAQWLRTVQEWLGEPVDVIGVHLDYDDSAGGIYYEVKLLCNDEDLAGVPIALRARRSSPE